LARHELPGDSLILEITEDLLLDNIDRTRDVLEALRECSIHIALDDFGSGYSALTYLRKLPIDEVKLDQDLIIHVLTDPRAEAIVRAVIELAHSLSVTTVAEGVETADIASWLLWLRMRNGLDHITGSARLTLTAGFEHALSGGFQSVGGVRPVSVDSCAVGRCIRSVAHYFSVETTPDSEQQQDRHCCRGPAVWSRARRKRATICVESRRIAVSFASFQTPKVRGDRP
jgi:hypothetical protein